MRGMRFSLTRATSFRRITRRTRPSKPPPPQASNLPSNDLPTLRLQPPWLRSHPLGRCLVDTPIRRCWRWHGTTRRTVGAAVTCVGRCAVVGNLDELQRILEMKRLVLRLRTIALLILIGWQQPGMFTVGTFQSMSKLMELLLKVANEATPTMTKIAVVVANEQHDLVTVWAGKGASANPYDRIVQLREELDELKQHLKEQP